MERKVIFQASLLAAVAAFASILFMGFGVPVPESGIELQPSLTFGPVADFIYPTNTYPDLSLRFFTADSFFVLSYLMVFVGLYAVASQRSRSFAAIGLGAGILTAILDATENAFFIAYAASAVNNVLLEEPALPLIYVLANLKWMGSFATLYAFGLVWPREDILEWMLSGFMLLFPVFGVLGVAFPDLVPWRGIFFLLGMPLFAWYFWKQIRSNNQH